MRWRNLRGSARSLARHRELRDSPTTSAPYCSKTDNSGNVPSHQISSRNANLDALSRGIPMINRFLWMVIVIAVTAASAHVDGGGITMESRIEPRAAVLGEPLQVTVVMKNVASDSILLVVRDANFAVEVESAGLQTIKMPRYTRRATRFKDDEVPLRPGDASRRELPVPLNDLRAALGEGWVGVPGAYRIRVRYDSEGSVQDRSLFAWKGSATSSWTNIYVRAPVVRERLRRLNEMQRCIGSDECDTAQTGNFFRVVRDKRAPALLLRLLQKRPYDIWLLDAIVFQGRRADAKRLRDLSSTVEGPSIRERYIDAAAKLERPPH